MEIINVKLQILNMVNNITCPIIWNDKISVTLHTLETWFASGIICKLLHIPYVKVIKVDDDDDDDDDDNFCLLK